MNILGDDLPVRHESIPGDDLPARHEIEHPPGIVHAPQLRVHGDEAIRRRRLWKDQDVA